MAFSRSATGLSHLPLCFESILRVTIESVQESQVYWKCIGTSGSFEMGTGPPEFLSSVKLRPPALEVPQERWHSFPDEAGKWTLLLGLGGKTGALLELWQDRQCSSPVETGMSVQGSSTVDTTPDTFMWRDLTGKTSQVSTCPLPEHLARNQNLLFTV